MPNFKQNLDEVEFSRRLAAIMFTDIVGFTALMGENEDKAMQVLSQFKSIAAPTVEKLHGKWHKDLGDGALCSFASALDAVKCAMEIQQQLNRETDYKVRIGIHLGDVTFQDGDVFGDGVNIASRIQGQAAEGGICVSEEVSNTIRNKEGIKLAFMEKKELKNVKKPVGLYQIIAEGIENKISSKRPRMSWALLTLTSLVFLLIGGFLGNKFTLNSEEQELERFHVNLPPGAPMSFESIAPFGISQTSLALSPDGNHLVYVALINNSRKLFLRSLDDFDAHPIEDTEGAYHPFFSPDGQSIGFFSGSQLKRVSIREGTTETLCEANQPLGAVWTSDNRIVFANDEGAHLSWISAFGGIAKKFEIQEITGGVQGFIDPYLLPDQKHLLVYSNWPRAIKVISLENGKQTVLLKEGSSPKYIKTGHIVYAVHGKLRVVPFDAKKLTITGNAITVVDDIRTGGWDMGQFGVSKDGTMVYAEGISAKLGQLIYRDFFGVEEDLPIKPGYWGAFEIGHKKDIITVSNIETWSIHTYDLNIGVESILKSETPYYNPILTLDDENIFFSDADEQKDIYVSDVKAIHPPKNLFQDNSDYKRWPVAISPDGKVLHYCETNPDTQTDIKFHYLDKDEEDLVLFPNKGDQQHGQFSPSGKYFAYSSDEEAKIEVYVQPFPMTGDRQKVSIDGGADPMWSPNGDKLYYMNDNSMMEVSVQFTNGISFSTPKMLFNRRHVNVLGRSINLTRDGEKFILIKPLSEKTATPKLKVVKNWFEEVKRLAPDD